MASCLSRGTTAVVAARDVHCKRGITGANSVGFFGHFRLQAYMNKLLVARRTLDCGRRAGRK